MRDTAALICYCNFNFIGNVWRPAGSLGVEQAEEATEQSEQKDVEMES